MGAVDMEILAPAGGPESLIAAVRCGADAVYLGGAGFLNARRNAAGFDPDQLAAAVAHCHGRGVKVYLTLNTLVRPWEQGLLTGALEQACALGVDAVLAQDLAVARTARAACPGLPLHASTQMSVTGVEGAKILEELGFARVVLGRELTLAEIARIRTETDIQLEAFVHGALCMSVSGQCYLSGVIGGRSGNRGLCAQPCRLPFACGRSGHALSLRDLSLLGRLEELAGAGICCVKIEGRMKRPEYVAAATAACVAARAGRPYDEEKLAAVFSRSGFTQGYLEGRRDAKMFGIRQKEDVAAATAALLREYEALYKNETQRVSVRGFLALRADRPVTFAVQDGEGNTAIAQGEMPQMARSAPTDEGRAGAALGKTGGTPFRMEDIVFDLEPGLMAPASGLNALRRRALEELLVQREIPRPHLWDGAAAQAAWTVEARVPPADPTWRVRLGRGDQLGAALDSPARLIILPLHLWGETDQSLLEGSGDRVAVELPRCTFGQDNTLPARLGELREQGVRHAVVGSLGALRQAREAGFVLHGDVFLNLFNAPALEEYRALGLQDATLSFELTLREALGLEGTLPRGALVYGYLPVMALRNCPARAHKGGCQGRNCGWPQLTDRMGKRFFLDCDGALATLYNCLPLWMADRMRELAGLDFITLYFTKESPGDVRQVLEDFARGAAPKGEHTRGLYYRSEHTDGKGKKK